MNGEYNMKRTYEAPELELTRFTTEPIMDASTPEPTTETPSGT